MNKPFKFKEFTIAQDQCAMKVGTDGVLLGAWSPLDTLPDSILDIGTGTGLIALMLAQRSNAEIIDALEIDELAYEQAVENFEASPWGDRLFCYHAGFDEFYTEIEDTYELIVSNPPFFIEEVSSGNQQRDTARQNFSLPFPELLYGAHQLLDKEKGVFALILPYKESEAFTALAAQVGLYPFNICDVKGHEDAPFKRSLMAFSYQQQSVKKTTLVIEKERHLYTQDYISLTKDFYLKM